jgi:hypothetical protein
MPLATPRAKDNGQNLHFPERGMSTGAQVTHLSILMGYEKIVKEEQNGKTVNILTGIGTGRKLRLQPAMTQWMMGYPDSWTEFPLAEANGGKAA